MAIDLGAYICFDDSAYIFAHGRPPRGMGSWAFSQYRDQREPMWVPGTMLYRDAKVWILAHVRKTYGDQARGILYVCT
jgi:hypothetical protein